MYGLSAGTKKCGRCREVAFSGGSTVIQTMKKLPTGDDLKGSETLESLALKTQRYLSIHSYASCVGPLKVESCGDDGTSNSEAAWSDTGYQYFCLV